MSYLVADVYLDDMKTLLDTYWIEYREVPKPQLIVVNDPTLPEGRFDLAAGDVIITTAEGPEQIRYRGNVHYYDRIVSVSLDMRTKEDRQRLHDMWKMVRIILFSRQHDFPNYQFIRMMGYQEYTDRELNLWRAVARVNLENICIPVEV